MITVFYDGACGLCKKEIRLYQRLDKDRRISWIDISQSTATLEQYNIAPLDALYELHVIDGFGRVFTGIEAFLTLWRELAYFKYLAPIVVLPGVKQFARGAYHLFVWWHARKLRVCHPDHKPPA